MASRQLKWRPKRGARIKVSPKDERTRGEIVFDSKKEARYWDEMQVLKRTGEVLMVLRQVPFDLPGGVKYRLDFQVFYADGNVEFVDVKGMRTEVYKIKKKQVEALYPIQIEER